MTSADPQPPTPPTSPEPQPGVLDRIRQAEQAAVSAVHAAEDLITAVDPSLGAGAPPAPPAPVEAPPPHDPPPPTHPADSPLVSDAHQPAQTDPGTPDETPSPEPETPTPPMVTFVTEIRLLSGQVLYVLDDAKRVRQEIDAAR